MAQDIEIANAQYNDVPSIEVPLQGGGTAEFVDTSDADAIASEIDMGKTAYVNGVKLTGTRSGGGGSYTRTQLYGEWKTGNITLLDDVTNYDDIELELSSTQYSTYLNYHRIPVDRLVNSGKDFNIPAFGLNQFFNFGYADATHLTFIARATIFVLNIFGIKY